MPLTSLGVFGLDGLFECGDIPECQQEQDDKIPFVLYRSYL